MTAEEIVQNYQIKLMKIIFKEIDILMTKKKMRILTHINLLKMGTLSEHRRIGNQ
ncbi:Orf31 [Lactococcus lactis subsp. lactis A12]|uniref:Orf31 n=1 Tax=Lactococcus lactis subsp. lactis A12 TaxID=1137134 RepID=S6FSG9_LACLL|nr:Orf31 [Lactococcus lactis subsp. lactis A12]